MMMIRRALPWTLLLLACTALSHDDQVGARFVQAGGIDATDCLDHHAACASIQYALAQADSGNTVKVAAGIYDMSGVDPATFLFGTVKAAGGYSDAAHFHEHDPDAYETILVGVDARYRQAMRKQGFKWAADYASAAAGLIDDSIPEALQKTQLATASCLQGMAGQFPCRNVDFLAQIPLNGFSTTPPAMSNLWGFVDLNDGREYVVVGVTDGTAIIDITGQVTPREVVTIGGNLSIWREVKIYQHFDAQANRYRAYAYISTEAGNSGLQVIDLSGLPASATLANTLTDTDTQHTLYISNIDYATNMALPGREAFLYVAGADVGNGAWRVYSLADPAQPQLLASAPVGSQYMHDATSLYITDSRAAQCEPGHDPCEVLVDFNENTVDLWDVTNKSASVKLSSTTYPTARYTHSGWPNASQSHLLFHDETEEMQLGLNTRIYTMDLGNLRAPSIVTSYQGPATATDHNGYIKGNLHYVSHYRRGLVIFDATNPVQLQEVGHFDTFLAPSPNTAGTDGAWGVYPFFPSGAVAISDISNGLFVLQDNAAALAQGPGTIGFAATTMSVAEGAGSATVRVRRTGGFIGAVSVQYATGNGTALAGSDYTAASGTLNWPAGDVDERTFIVPVVNDSDSEGDETLRITLSNPGGSAGIDAPILDVTISNDDAAPDPIPEPEPEPEPTPEPVPSPSPSPTPAPAPAPSGGGGGGGMPFDLLMLLTMLGIAARRPCRRERV